MEPTLSGKKVLVVRGSLLAEEALEAALVEQGAKVITATNLISAFSLIEREKFDGVVIDKGLHNGAIDLFAELASLGVPYVTAQTPHELQKPSAKKRAASEVVAALAARLKACNADYEDGASAILAARYPVARGMASMGRRRSGTLLATPVLRAEQGDC